MLDIVDLIQMDPDLREFYMDTTPDSSHGIMWNGPSRMYLRMFASDDYADRFTARFRFNQAGETQRQEYNVLFSRTRADIPLTQAQMRMWDEIRTELALGSESGWHVWTGMAQQPRIHVDQKNVLWDQNHVFFLLRNHQTRQFGEVIGFHYEKFSFPGTWKESQDYRDYSFRIGKSLATAPTRKL